MPGMGRTENRSFDRLFLCEDAPSLVPARCSLRRVLVVGSGVAGLQTARQMRGLGLEVLVLEQSDDIGGVWQRNYHGVSALSHGSSLLRTAPKSAIPPTRLPSPCPLPLHTLLDTLRPTFSSVCKVRCADEHRTGSC